MGDGTGGVGHLIPAAALRHGISVYGTLQRCIIVIFNQHFSYCRPISVPAFFETSRRGMHIKIIYTTFPPPEAAHVTSIGAYATELLL